MRVLIGLLSIVIAGCGTGQVIQAAPNDYSVTSSGAGFSTDGVKTDVYRAANEYCAQKSLVMVEDSIKTQDGALGRNPPSADLRFHCVAQGNLEIKRHTSSVHTEVIEGSGHADDSYTKLKQLKELLDSGVLTQKEFDEQKEKVLSR